MDLTDQIDPISAFDILRQRVTAPAMLIPSAPLQSSIPWSTRIFEALKKHWPECVVHRIKDEPWTARNREFFRITNYARKRD